jgi:hypothetical protein
MIFRNFSSKAVGSQPTMRLISDAIHKVSHVMLNLPLDASPKAQARCLDVDFQPYSLACQNKATACGKPVRAGVRGCRPSLLLP